MLLTLKALAKKKGHDEEGLVELFAKLLSDQGLAEKAISKYYLPSSNFIPIATLKNNQPDLLTGYESGFCSFDAEFYPEQFLLCDTIYLKFDIKTTKDILENY
jgi:hypothetical protein